MTAPEFEACGEVDQGFTLPARGWVLVLKSGWTGYIPRGGIIESGTGHSLYVGPEFLLREKEESVCVVVAENAKSMFEPGQKVRLYKLPGVAS